MKMTPETWIGFGLIFVWAMFPTSEIMWHLHARGETETASGIVIENTAV